MRVGHRGPGASLLTGVYPMAASDLSFSLKRCYKKDIFSPYNGKKQGHCQTLEVTFTEWQLQIMAKFTCSY